MTRRCSLWACALVILPSIRRTAVQSLGCRLQGSITLPETKPASLHLKMDGWSNNCRLGWPIFRGELLVSGSVNYL